jgi:hypothetical protein
LLAHGTHTVALVSPARGGSPRRLAHGARTRFVLKKEDPLILRLLLLLSPHSPMLRIKLFPFCGHGSVWAPERPTSQAASKRRNKSAAGSASPDVY